MAEITQPPEIVHTDAEKTQSVKAAYDSVGVIDTSEDSDEVDRNVEHIKIMMGYNWFVEALTPKQKKELNDIIK